MTDDAILEALEGVQAALKDLRIELADLRKSSVHVPVDGLVGIQETCRLLGVGARTLRRLRARRGFPRPVRGPGRLRWRRRDLVAYLERAR